MRTGISVSPSNLKIPISLILTTSIDSPKLSSINLETIFFTFWAVSVADWEGLLSKPKMEKITTWIAIHIGYNCFIENIQIVDNSINVI